ncbi:MAG: FAD-dependent oxidoreductase [Bosea sp. (in: a-proteobacteria)]|uniref:FAD/NAD(P)-dependent oxidoreductase n=1 Tax=Bosea sp. (in: a-proteobacteria) TaxID=1871050 RepID=UPI0027375075|nr:FAD-dependent oxidoreductase [Bosea sp. (in: a-proteobacteria)]MDP3602627.1 FAD-dependent oxidoreductase [Bosea sp. (in: a-proteobacteria)]
MAAHDPKSVAGKDLPVAERTQLLVIGAGPAGLAAAIEAAERGLSVILVDENPVSITTMGDEVPLHFGQAMSAQARNRNAMMEAFIASEPLIEAAFEAGVDLRLGTACWGLYSNGPSLGWLPGTVAGLNDDERCWMLAAQQVIVATGRRDMGLAFPGWEKPGVLGATAALALAGRYGALEPRRIVMLGSSTEALVTALALRDAGVVVAAIVEQADEIIGSPELAGRLKAGGTQLLTRHVVREATGRDHVEAALVSTVDTEGRAFGPERSLACDGIVLAVGATPVVDLLDALGCRIAFQPERGGYAPLVDGDQRTSLRNVFAVGDAAGLWSDKTRDRSIAEAEGRCAAAAIARDCGVDDGRAVAAAAPPGAPECDISAYRLAWVRASVVEARAEVHVCQCEEVTAREILEVRPPRYLGWQDERRNDRSLSALLGDGPPNPDQVKRLTRAGMGPCQGRRCREQVSALLALGAAVPLSSIPLASYRAPVRPLPLSVAGQIPEAPEQAEHWDTWFGMHAQWRPFWEVPALYTVAGNDAAGPVASE